MLQRNRTQSVQTDNERFIVGISSCNYGGQEVPGFSICKLENQESLWCYLFKIWRLEIQEHQCLRVEENGCPSLSEDSKFTLYLPLCGIQALNWLDNAYPYWWGWSFLLNLPIKIHPEIIFCQLSGHPLAQIKPPFKVTHKFNHHKPRRPWFAYETLLKPQSHCQCPRLLSVRAHAYNLFIQQMFMIFFLVFQKLL